MLTMFIRLTLIVALVIVALFIAKIVFGVVLFAAIVAAVILGGLFAFNFLRRSVGSSLNTR